MGNCLSKFQRSPSDIENLLTSIPAEYRKTGYKLGAEGDPSEIYISKEALDWMMDDF